MTRYVFAVDGGGSKTDAELTDPAGVPLARTRGGPSNLYRDPDAALAAIDAAWRECCRAAGLDPAETAPQTILSAALAGATALSNHPRFRVATAPFAAAHLSTDAYAALLGAFDGGPGLLLVVGTGAIGSSRDPGGAVRHVGGWGFPASDQGSGAWIGLRLVTAWLEHHDGLAGTDPADAPLWQAAETHLGTDRQSILAWLRAATPAAYGALAPAVVRADAASRVATDILDAAAGHLARLVHGLAPPERLPVAVTGGLAHALAPRLTRLLGHAPIENPPSALHGARLIAAGRSPPEYL